MARVINLRDRQSHAALQRSEEPVQPRELPPEPVIQHPIVQQQRVFTDSGPALPYETLRWIAPASYRQGSTIAPYIVAVLLAVGAILIGIFQRDTTTAILFGFLAVMTVVHIRRPVPLVEVEVSPLSIKVSEHTYRYEEIKSFWIQYEPEFDIRELSLHLKKWYQPYVKVQIEDQDPVQIRAILLEFIPEVEHEETLVHSLTRRLGL